MKLVLTDSAYLKDSIAIISDLVNEARFKISRDAVEMIAMDPANVAMVIFKLLSSAFTEYELKKEQDIAISLANFKQILRRASPSDILTLELASDNKLKIQLRGATIRTFSLPLIEIEEKEQKIPTLSFPVTVTMQSSALSSAIEDAGIVAESVSFIAEPDCFAVNAEGDLSKVNVEMKAGDDIKIKSETKAKIRARYSIEYLKKMAQGSKISEQVDVCFNQDYPLKIEYKIIDRVLLSFILAPRVEND